MKIKIASLVLIISILGCTQYNSKVDIILQIGSFNLTNAECDYIRSIAKYKELTNEQYYDKLMEEAVILAYARDNKFDTIELLNKQLQYAQYYYASKVDGYVWNKKVEPNLNVTEEDIRDVYKKRSSELHFDIIHFPNERLLRKYHKSGDPILLENQFNLLKQTISADQNIKYYSDFKRYPFYPFCIYIEEIGQASVGEIFGPFETLNGFYVIRINGKNSLLPQPYEQAKNAINQDLINLLKEKHVWESQKNIFLETNPQIYESAIEEIASKVNTNDRQWPGVDPEMVLMKYYFNGEHRNYSVADFIEFVYCQPVFFGSLSNPDDITKMLKTYLVGVYLYETAKQMNMDNDIEYQRFIKRYQQNIFIDHYKKSNIYPEISISEIEIKNYYQKHQNSLLSFETAIFDVYKFEDVQKAANGRMLILGQDNRIPKRKDLPVAETIELNVKYSKFDKPIIDVINNLKIDQLSYPIKIGSEYWIIYLTSKNGQIPFPYQYVKNEIKQSLLLTKEQNLWSQQVKKLEILYPIEVNYLKEYLAKTKRI